MKLILYTLWRVRSVSLSSLLFRLPILSLYSNTLIWSYSFEVPTFFLFPYVQSMWVFQFIAHWKHVEYISLYIFSLKCYACIPHSYQFHPRNPTHKKSSSRWKERREIEREKNMTMLTRWKRWVKRNKQKNQWITSNKLNSIELHCMTKIYTDIYRKLIFIRSNFHRCSSSSSLESLEC